MQEFTKSYRMRKRTATEIRLIGVKNDLTAGQVLDALCKMQGASKYLRKPEDRALLERIWGQAVLSAQRAGKSGWKEPQDPNDVTVEI